MNLSRSSRLAIIKPHQDQLSSTCKAIQHFIDQQSEPPYPEITLAGETASTFDIGILDAAQLSSGDIKKLLHQDWHQSDKHHWILINANPNQGEFAQCSNVAGILPKQTPVETICKAIAKIQRGTILLPEHAVQYILRTRRSAPAMDETTPLQKLSEREQQVIALLPEGLSNRDIGERLYVSEHTVKSHLYNAFQKLGLKNRLQASNWVQINCTQNKKDAVLCDQEQSHYTNTTTAPEDGELVLHEKNDRSKS